MLQKHSDLIMKQLQPSDIVLDIGGWAHPFNRANYILDQEPYGNARLLQSHVSAE